MYRMGMLVKIEIPFIASSSGSLFCLNIAEKALPMSQGIDPGPISVFPDVISIILEEAPRVLGKEVLEKGPNIFSTIAREGRKFRVGLIAITQLPSLIPREILANMNTKIILYNEHFIHTK